MNAKKSLLFYILAILVFAGVVYGFATGATQEETGLKVAWMSGSLAVAALGVALSYKLRK